MATDVLLAWLGTMGLLAFWMGLARANNAKSRAVSMAVAFVFWLAFVFSAYQVRVDGSPEAMPVLAWLGVGAAAASLVVLVKEALAIIGEEAPEDDTRRAVP